MDGEIWMRPGLTVALALVMGMAAQSLAFHLRVPSIILLLGLGLVLGPDGLGWIRPDTLGPGLPIVVGFAVAVILFEGGLNLNLQRLRRAQRPIRRLITLGAVVTAVGGALAAHGVLGWDWRMAVLFGTLIIVTGPTVIGPLLRRIKVKSTVATVLTAEGVLIDAIGAIVATAALEVALSPSGATLAEATLRVGASLGLGALVGGLGGALLAVGLRFRNFIPEGFESVLVLGSAMALYQLANALMHESGIAAAIAAGMVLGNADTHAREEIMAFEEQLTVMLVGMLFVLLAADVRMRDVWTVGWPGVQVVAVVILAIRPLGVALSTFGTDLQVRERAFLAWIGPRGIVAAAVASLFALELERAGLPQGPQLQALVFMVIGGTVFWSGLTGPLAARLLGVSRQTNAGWIILGANELARVLGKVLQDGGEEVVCIDSNPEASQRAQDDGLRVIYANALEARTLLRAEVDTRLGALALTRNESINLLFLQKVKQESRHLKLLIALVDGQAGVTPRMVEGMGGDILFGTPRHVDTWCSRIRDGRVKLQWRRRAERAEPDALVAESESRAPYMPLVIRRRKNLEPFAKEVGLRSGPEVLFLVDERKEAEVDERLRDLGWLPVDEEVVPIASTKAPSPRPTAPGAG